MKDERRDQLQEQYEDAAFSLLMDQYAEEEGKRLLLEFEEAEQNGDIPEIPPELDEKCLQLIKGTFAKKRRKDQIRRISRKLTSVAALVLIFLGLATTLVMSVDAIRIPVMNYILQHDDRYSTLILGDENDIVQIRDNILNRLKSSPIPEDYSLLTQYTDNDGTLLLCYQNPSKEIVSLSVSRPNGILNYDTEKGTQVETTISGHSALFVNKDGYRLMWINSEEDLLYELFSSDLDEQIFWKIAHVLAD